MPRKLLILEVRAVTFRFPFCPVAASSGPLAVTASFDPVAEPRVVVEQSRLARVGERVHVGDALGPAIEVPGLDERREGPVEGAGVDPLVVVRLEPALQRLRAQLAAVVQQRAEVAAAAAVEPGLYRLLTLP